MANHGKRYRQARDKVERDRRYSIPDAVAVLKSLPKVKFNESVEVSLHLGIDPKQADQMIRGSVALPHGTGKDVRVVAFCAGAKAEEATAAGAVEAGAEELVEKIQKGWADFDVAVASPDMMRHVGKLGRILGPQGKMPSPKSGTVTEDVVAAVKEFRAGRIEYRADAGGNLHAPVGKVGFEDRDLQENVEAFIARIQAARPAAVKGIFIRTAHVSSTMGPSIRLAV